LTETDANSGKVEGVREGAQEGICDTKSSGPGARARLGEGGHGRPTGVSCGGECGGVSG